jgi:hypothetical protein
MDYFDADFIASTAGQQMSMPALNSARGPLNNQQMMAMMNGNLGGIGIGSQAAAAATIIPMDTYLEGQQFQYADDFNTMPFWPSVQQLGQQQLYPYPYPSASFPNYYNNNNPYNNLNCPPGYMPFCSPTPSPSNAYSYYNQPMPSPFNFPPFLDTKKEKRQQNNNGKKSEEFKYSAED